MCIITTTAHQKNVAPLAEDKRPLCPLSSKRLEDNWHSGVLSSAKHRLSGRRSPHCSRVSLYLYPPLVRQLEFLSSAPLKELLLALGPRCLRSGYAHGDDDCLPPRDTSPHQDARAQPPAAHRRRHSRPHHRRHGEHSPTARQPHSNGLCSPPKDPGPGSALRRYGPAL